MAKLDMRKALAGAVTPLDASKLAGESMPELRLVDEVEPVAESTPTDDGVAAVADNRDSNVAVDEEAGAIDPAVTTPSRRHPSTRKPSPVAKPAARPEPSAAAPVTAMGVDVEPALNARFVAFRNATRLSYHQIILDAVEHSYPVLGDLVAKALGRGGEAAVPQVKLFERTFVPPPVPVRGRQDRITHTIRITVSNRSMLDDVAAEVSSPSRNFMICVALDHYLPAE
ncbi:hypothetical protein [Microbacterium sp. LMI1-1-1.1]|uniref:hypothetical protein n=1 Tax=Microbacterium sp. LMI1-1-1.1 TaxID=3135223 RepID=UPI003465F4A4